MRGLVVLALIAVLPAAIFAATVSWDVGMTYVYSLDATVAALGQTDTSTKDSTTYVTGSAFVTCVAKGKDAFSLSMTLRDTVFLDASRVPMDVGADPSILIERNPMLFVQTSSGLITSVSPSSDDSVWIVVFKKGILSALQVMADSSNAVDVVEEAVGAHRVKVNMIGDRVIASTYDHSHFLNALPKGLRFAGATKHVLSAPVAGSIQKAVLSHHAVFTKRTEMAAADGDTTEMDPTNAEISSAGNVVLTLVRKTPMEKAMPPSILLGGEVAGFYASSLVGSAEELLDAGSSTDPEDVTRVIEDDVNDLVHNPLGKSSRELASSAHHIVAFLWSHPMQFDAVKMLLAVSPSPAHPELIEFVLRAAVEPARTEPPVRMGMPRGGWSVKDANTACEGSTPHCKAYDWSTKLGSSGVNMDLAAGYYGGTNFDCHHDDLNYKLEAHASAKASVFGYSHDVLNAQAVYEVMAGGTVQNRLWVAFWDKTLKDEKLIPVDIPGCPPETVQKLWSAEPGIHYSYYLMIGPVPVQFSVGVTLHLELDWGYQVCLQDLKARVDLQPWASLEASASAAVTILVARAGIELGGSINQKLVPAAWINGNQCSFGVDVRRQGSAASIKFDAFYELKSCHISHWHLHCGWGDHHEWVIWSWSSPPVDQLLWGEVCRVNPSPFSISCQPE